MTQPAIDSTILAIRSFNRFYTRQIGVLNRGYLDSPYSLAEVRVMYEIAHKHGLTATDLVKSLGLDAGYLSRLLAGFEKRGLISRAPSQSDGRQNHLSLTNKGEKAFQPLQDAANAEVAAMLSTLRPGDRERLVGAMRTIETVLGGNGPGEPAFTLRQHRPGDMGWVVHRHGVLYSEEYGWDEQFEALVADIAAKFILNLDPNRERCWIAERHGEIVGSVFLVAKDDEVAKLRLLFVEPSARGLGIGKRLVKECITFAREVGYKRMTLWTQQNLTAARRIYQQKGFVLTQQEQHHSFGFDLVGETWELDL